MITAEKTIKIDPAPKLDPVADTNIVHPGALLIHVSGNDPNYHLFEELLTSLKIQIKENIESAS